MSEHHCDDDGETVDQALSRAGDVLAATEMLLLERQMRGTNSSVSAGWCPELATPTSDPLCPSVAAAAAAATTADPAAPSAAPPLLYGPTAPRHPAPASLSQDAPPQATPHHPRPLRLDEGPASVAPLSCGGPGGRPLQRGGATCVSSSAQGESPPGQTPTTDATHDPTESSSVTTGQAVWVAVFFAELNRNVPVHVSMVEGMPTLHRRLRDVCGQLARQKDEWTELFLLDRSTAAEGRWFRALDLLSVEEGAQLLFRVRRGQMRAELPEAHSLPPVEGGGGAAQGGRAASPAGAEEVAEPRAPTPPPRDAVAGGVSVGRRGRRDSLLPTLQGAGAGYGGVAASETASAVGRDASLLQHIADAAAVVRKVREERPAVAAPAATVVSLDGPVSAPLPAVEETPPNTGESPALGSDRGTTQGDPKNRLAAFHDTIVQQHKRILELERDLEQRSLPIPAGYEMDRIAILQHPLAAHLQQSRPASSPGTVRECPCYVSKVGSEKYRISRVRVVERGGDMHVSIDSSSAIVLDVPLGKLTHFGPFVDTSRKSLSLGLSVYVATHDVAWVVVMTSAETATRWIEWFSRHPHIFTSNVTAPP